MKAEGACPTPTPEQARFGAALAKIEDAILESIIAAVVEAHEAADGLTPIRDGDAGVSLGYFTAVAHHRLFTTLCGADREAGKSGDPAIAAAVLRNFQGLAKSWEAARIAIRERNGRFGAR